MYTDMHKWYLALEEATETTKKYEDNILKFYKVLRINPKNILEKPFLSNFYKKESFAKRIVPIILSKIIISIIIGVVLFLVSWLVAVANDEEVFLEALKNTSYLKLGIIIGIIALVVSEALFTTFAYLKYKSLVKKFEKDGQDLKEIMITLPSQFRRSELMNHIYRSYYSKKGISPDIAFKVAEEMLHKYGSERVFEGVFFDLPYQNDFVQQQEEFSKGQEVVEKSEEEKVFDNPNLPADIKSKTFKGSDDAQKDLNEMIGLESVKDQIQKLENRIKFYGSGSTNGNHMQFLGSAGTGKTTVARIVTKILYDLGYIKKNQYVEISGDYLRTGTTARTDAILEYSMGGVLFIDEAYLLYDKLGISSDAIGILLKAMEDRRSDFVVILAGYEEQMTRLIASNEGFSSRIKHTIYFPDYTEDECLDIFKYFIKNYNNKSYKLSEGAVDALLELFKLEKQAKSFGNARTVRNAVEGILDYYIDRNIASNTDNKIIEQQDVEKYYNDRKVALQHELKNASAANQVDESIIRLSELKSKVKAGSEHPFEDLRKLVGLNSFKNELDLLKNQKEFYKTTDPQKVLFIGNQGSGKSSLVKVLTGYLYELGYIQENKYLDVSADFLKGSYVGHTTKRAESIISYATGGVLYIKNINIIANSTDGFASEVLAAINNALNSNLTVVIGDTDSNYIESISNMFNIKFVIPDYNDEQLTEIFVQKAEEDGFTVEEAAKEKVLSILAKKTNVRDAISLYNNAKKKHITNFTEETKYILTEQDIEKPVLKLNIKL